MIISPYIFPGLKDAGTLRDYHTVEDAVNMICDLLGYDVSKLMSKTRKQDIVFSRSIIIKKLRDFHYSTVEIGKFFGRDHSTIIYNSINIFESIYINGFSKMDDYEMIERFITNKRTYKKKLDATIR